MNLKRLLILLTIIFLLTLFSYIVPAVADNGNSSDIEKIVDTENCRTVYFQNGSKHVYLTLYFKVNVNFSVTLSIASTVTLIPIFPFDQLLQIIQEIIEGVFSPLGIALTLLATEILILFKNLRHNRPRDYHGVSFLGARA